MALWLINRLLFPGMASNATSLMTRVECVLGRKTKLIEGSIEENLLSRKIASLQFIQSLYLLLHVLALHRQSGLLPRLEVMRHYKYPFLEETEVFGYRKDRLM